MDEHLWNFVKYFLRKKYCVGPDSLDNFRRQRKHYALIKHVCIANPLATCTGTNVMATAAIWVWLLTRSILNGRRSFICIRVASGRTRQSTRVAPFPISRGRTCGQSQTFLSVSRQHYEWPLPLFNPGTLMAATLMYRFGHIQCAPVPALDTAGPCADQLIILYIIIYIYI